MESRFRINKSLFSQVLPVQSKGREGLLYRKGYCKPIVIPFCINTNDNDVMYSVDGMNDAGIFSSTDKFNKQFLERNINISWGILAKQMI